MNKKPRAAIYARVSKAEDDAKSPSVARQQKLLRELATREGYNVVAECSDDGISGFALTKDLKPVHRPGWEQVRGLVERGDVDLVLAVAQDRMSRNTEALLGFATSCRAQGVKWHLLERGLTDPAQDELLTTMLAAVAQQESRAKQLRLQHSNDERAAEGKPHPSSRRLFGYAEDRVSPHETEAAFVTAAFADYAAGSVTLGEIARRWRNAGLKTTVGNDFRSGGVGLMLRNPRYAGQRVHRGQVVEGVAGAWEPLTDPETFALVQARLESRKGSNKREVIPTTLLGGIARCRCGQALRPAHGGRKDKNGQTVRTYRCNKSLVDPKGKHVAITAKRLDDYVTRVVADEFLIGHVADDQLVEQYGVPEVKQLEKELEELHARDSRVQDAYEAGAYDVTEMAGKRSELAKAISGVETRLASVRGSQVDRAWIERAREIAANSDALTLDAAVEEFGKLSLTDRRGLIGSLFTVSVLPSTSSTPIDDRAIVFFKGSPNFAASKPAQILEESK